MENNDLPGIANEPFTVKLDKGYFNGDPLFTTTYLSLEEVITKYGDMLSEEELKALKEWK